MVHGNDGLADGFFVCGLAALDDDMLCKALGWLVLAGCMDLCE